MYGVQSRSRLDYAIRFLLAHHSTGTGEIGTCFISFPTDHRITDVCIIQGHIVIVGVSTETEKKAFDIYYGPESKQGMDTAAWLYTALY